MVAGNAVPLARRVPTLDGRVVGLLDNSKSGIRPFLDRIEELLQREQGVSRIIRHAKKAAARPAPDEMLEAAIRECDSVAYAHFSSPVVAQVPRRCGEEVARILTGQRPLNMINPEVYGPGAVRRAR